MLNEVNKLVRAARDGCGSTIAELVAAFPNIIDLEDSRSRKALQVAAQLGRTDVICLLVANGADVNGIDRLGRTALYCASQCGRHSAAEALIGFGAKLELADSKGRTPLFAAASMGLPSTIELLVSKGALVGAADSQERTPLHAAVKKGSAKTVIALIALGASVETKDANGRTPLTIAIMRGRLPTIKALVAGQGAKEVSRDLLFVAAHAGQLSSLRFLHEEMRLKLIIPDRKGRSLLNVAVRGRSVEADAVSYLLSRKVFDCNEVIGHRRHEKHRRTLLQLAAKNNCAKMIEALCAAGAKINGLGTNHSDLQRSVGDAAILTGSQYGSLEATKKLLKLGADVKARTSFGNHTVLHVCCEYGYGYGYGYGGCAGNFQDVYVPMFAAAGLDINATNSDGQTALHIFVANRRGDASSVRALLAHGANTEVKDAKGMRPLQLACTPCPITTPYHSYNFGPQYYFGAQIKKAKEASVTALLELGADVQAVNPDVFNAAKQYHGIGCITELAKYGVVDKKYSTVHSKMARPNLACLIM